MNAETKITSAEQAAAGTYQRLAPRSFQALAPLTDKMDALDQVLSGLAQVSGTEIETKARQLRRKLAAVAPAVTMIGQVKAGKTSLVNAMVGWPDLLPADVNPWTSVVTSLHMTPAAPARDTKAEFRFFEQSEWDRLVTGGGRVGEIAGRAGADTEMEKVRQQIAAMQEKSRKRLGRKFELLLGQSHDYGEFDSDLIERYVCLGDDFDTETDVTRTNGRFADITKSADLYLHRPGLPMAMTIRDTPGVNDTFMVREQITIRSIRDSRICVVVLSAHQALSAVDMALIRLISNIDAREVVIFVNRIDELSDPATQVPEIRDSIRATLDAHQGPSGVEIIFGSALWANLALRSSNEPLAADTAAALRNWATAHKGQMPGVTDTQSILWQLSGLPALFDGIARRIIEGPGREAFDAISKRAENLAHEVAATGNRVAARGPSQAEAQIDLATVPARLDRMRQDMCAALDTELDRHLSEFDSRLDTVHSGFLQRATAALIDHLDRFGEDDVWSYDPTGLRVLFRSAYQLYAKRTLASATSAMANAAAQTSELYRATGLINDAGFGLRPPEPPHVAPPVLLGQTIALDMQGNWWSKWWRRRRGYESFSAEFYALIQAETQPILHGLKTDHALALRQELTATLTGFLDDQAEALQRLVTGRTQAGSMPHVASGSSAETRRRAAADALGILESLAA